MPSAGFEPAIPATKPPQTYVLDRAATGIGHGVYKSLEIKIQLQNKTERERAEYLNIPKAVLK
jgi:hypothetical protein